MESAFNFHALLLGPTFFLPWLPTLGAGDWSGLFIYLFIGNFDFNQNDP